MESYSTNSIKHHRNIVLMMVSGPLLVMVLVSAIFYISNSHRSAEAAVLLSNNFENGLGWSTQSVSADRLKTVSQTDNGKLAPQGTKLARFELRQGDNPLAQWCCQTTNRVEFTTSTNEQKGQDRWYSWYQMFDTTFPSYNTYPESQSQGWQIFAQWHGNDSLSPPLAWWAAGDNIVLARGNGSSYTELWRGGMNRGSWINIKMHIIWGDSGTVQLWINNSKVLDKSGVDNITNPPLYFKTGMYRPNSLSAKAITYMDDFKMGTSQSDVSGATPSIPVPNPLPPAPTITPPQPSSPTPTPSPAPPIIVPNPSDSNPVEIPADLAINQEGDILADIDGDGLNDISKDTNKDGKIDPRKEIIVDGATDQNLTDKNSQPISTSEIIQSTDADSQKGLRDDPGIIALKPGPLPEVKIAKPVAYTFLIAQGIALTGISSYLALTKLAIFAGIRSRLGL